ncbi:hypothetical protein HDU82_007409 [Entophlyctis luteolus]|nr:hypothetical protein HDU82_007409 [Entophlyctis luteolus]
MTSHQYEPNQHIVLQGLASSSTDASVMADLEHLGGAVESARVVMDRNTEITTDFGAVPVQVNDGLRDSGSVPSNLLVILGLDVLTTEESLFSSIQAHVPLPPLPTQIRLIKDRSTHQSLGFGFLDFSDAPTAHAFLLSASSNGTNRPLEVDSRSVSLAYAATGSFVQVYEPSKWVCRVSSAGGAGGLYRYGDEAAYASVGPEKSVPTNEYLIAISASDPNFASIDDEFAAFMEEVGGVGASEVNVNTMEPPVAEEAMAYTIIKPAVLSDEPRDSFVQPTNNAVEPDVEEFGGGETTMPFDEEDRCQINPERLALLDKNYGAPVADAQELSDGDDEQGPTDSAVSNQAEVQIDLSDEALLMRLPPVEQINREKSDLGIMACLLCERQFKSQEELAKHQAKSSLHKTNLQALREIQIADLRSLLMQQKQQQQHQQTQRYRNRAAERRKMYGQPARAPADRNEYAPYPSVKPKDKRVYAPGHGYGAERAFSSSQLPAVAAPATIGEDNIGNKMLRAMGWKEGSGLGAKGDGIVAPIAAESYAKGAGVGSMPLMKK